MLYRSASFLILLFAMFGCHQAPPPVQPNIPEVSVSLPIQREIQEYKDFTGRTDSINTVEVQARVSGYLMKVNFKEGDLVKENEVLYRIDERPFQADLDRAKGEVERLEAQKKLLKIQVDRYEKLAAKGAASQQDLDQYLGQQAENVGALKAAKAQVERADLNVTFCTITSPLNGMISRTRLTAGNLVNADTTLLTSIVAIDPMYAYFNVEEPVMLRIQRMIREGVLEKQPLDKIKVRMGLADDYQRDFPFEGALNFVNNQFDPTTGTIMLRGLFKNPQHILLPGMFVRVRAPIGPLHKGLLVTERAIGTDQGQKYLYVVDKDNKVQYRRVKLGALFDGLRSIDEGLTADERVIVSGLQRVRPKMEVKPQVVDMADQPKADESEVKPAIIKPETLKAPSGANGKSSK